MYTRKITIPIVLSCGLATNINAKPHSNVIFILVDDLGKEWIQQYGAENIELPNLEKLSSQSIIFERAYSMPQSTPSRVSLLTGQYPYNNGWVNHYDVPRWGNGAHFDFNKNPCFPRQIRKNGYKTCIAGKWQLNDFRLQPDAMKEAGFDEYCMWTGYETGNEKLSESRYWDPYIHTKEGSKLYKGKFGPDIYSDFIIDFILKNKDNPFFVFYPMTLTHTPFVHTPLDMNAKTRFEKHKAMIKYTDFIIGKIIKTLENENLYDNTYIFFVTDNGTAGTCVNKRNGEFISGGKTFLSENGINTPMFVHVPGMNKKYTSTALIDFTDVYPTLLELTGSEPEKKYKIDGISFASVLENKGNGKGKKYALSMGSHSAKIENGVVKNQVKFRDRVIIGQKYKIYLDINRDIIRVYDICKDKYEENNLVADKDVMSEVKTYFADIINSLPKDDENPKYTHLQHNKELDVELKSNPNIPNNFKPKSNLKAYKNFINEK